MSKISQVVSTILNIHIEEGKWKKSLDIIDRSGEPTLKNMSRILFALCQEIEEMELTLSQKEEALQKEEKYASDRS